MQQRPEPAYASQPTMKPAQTYTGFFGKIREKLRDKTRDKLCSHLCAMGVDARIAERGRLEERLRTRWSSLGLIETRNSAICWVNVLNQSGLEHTVYSNVYLVPDPRVPKGGYLELKSVRVKSAPVFGRVLDLRWEANFVTIGIKSMPVLTRKSVPVKMESNFIRRLNEDISLKESLLGLNEEVMIRSFEDWGWVMESGGEWPATTVPMPSRKQWDCYETIARHLLEAEEGELI